MTANLKELSIEVVSNNGSVGKTILSIVIAEYFRRKGQIALFTLDNNNQELSNVYATVQKGKRILPENDDALTGVGYYDFRTNADEGIRNLRKYKGIHVLKDYPADSIDAQCAMGDFARQVKAYKGMNKKIVYFVMGSSMKCIKSFASLNELLSSSPDIDYSNIEIVIALNEGMLKATKEYDKFFQAYNLSDDVKELKAKCRVHELFILTQLDEKDVSVIKKYTISKIQELDDNASEEVDYFMRLNSENVYEEIFNQLDKLVPLLTQ